MSENFSETSLLKASAMQAPLRIWTIAMGTFTQLVRMKTFWFLLVFAVIVAAISNIDFRIESPTAQLEMVKKVSFGTMDLFAWIYAIVATALLIPRDIEDRTLYTILTKPVNRLEYLIGKLVGVLMVIGLSLVIMLTLCMVILFFKQQNTITELMVQMKADARLTQADINAQVDLIKQQGARPALLVAGLASWLKASVVAAVAILISTFASSSLFTIITSIFLFLIGHAHGMVIDLGMQITDGNVIVEIFGKVLKLMIPDYQIFSFSEGIVIGANVVPHLVWGMIFLTAGYLFIFLLVSLIIFLHKEF